MTQRFSLDRSSFEQFIAAMVSLQPLRQAYAGRPGAGDSPLLPCLLETLHAIDAGELPLQKSLERVLDLCLRITGAEGAALWIVTGQELTCPARVGVDFENDLTRRAVRARLQCVDALEEERDRSPESRDALNVEEFNAQIAENSSPVGPSLLAAVLQEGAFTGAVAAFSNNARAFGTQDGASLKLLAGLVEYVLTKTLVPAQVTDLYVPGLGTRDALGDISDDQPHLAAIFREGVRNLAKARITLQILFRNAFSFSVQGSRATRRRFKSTLRTLLQHCALLWQKASSRVESNTLGKDLPKAVSAAVSSQLAGVSQQSQMSVSLVLRRFRRARYALLRQLIDMHELMLRHSEQWREWRTAAGESAQSSLSRNSSQLLRAIDRYRVLSRQLAGSKYQWARVHSRHLLSSSTHVMALIGTRCRDARLPRRTVRTVGPAIATLAVMSLFIVGLMADRCATSGPLPSNSRTGEPAGSSMPGNSNLSPAVTPVGDVSRSQLMPEHSHLQITDPPTATTIAAMSTAEMRTLRRAAAFGDDEAAMQLGMLYELGTDLPQSCTMAAQWVIKAAQLGNPAAEYNLGLRYGQGDGVEVNLNEAERWLRKAELHKDVRATQALALLVGTDKAHFVEGTATPVPLERNTR